MYSGVGVGVKDKKELSEFKVLLPYNVWEPLKK